MVNRERASEPDGSRNDNIAQIVESLRSIDTPERGVIDVCGWKLEYVGPRALARTLTLIIHNRVYDVPYLSEGSRIIDAGAHLGVSTLWWLRLYPFARGLAFEPDPALFPLLVQNLMCNGAASRVTAVNVALACDEGERTFYTTFSDAGTLTQAGWGQPLKVRTARLSTYLDDPVGLLKLNVEGAEWEIIDELGEKLSLVEQILIEYHGFWQLPQTLHRILERLDSLGFIYILSHFNDENRSCVPPLRIDECYRFFLLIYARKRNEGKSNVF